MAAHKTVLKLFIIIILAIFLLSTGLISVLYLGGNKNAPGTGDILSGDVTIQTGIIDTGVVDTETSNIKTVEVGTVSPIIGVTGTK